MKLIKKEISLEELKKLAQAKFGQMVKAVVDMERELMVIGGELHADEERLLLEKGSKQENLWGINLYPEKQKKDWLEFDAMINLRPSLNNPTRGINNPQIRKKIVRVVNRLVKR